MGNVHDYTLNSRELYPKTVEDYGTEAITNS